MTTTYRSLDEFRKAFGESEESKKGSSDNKHRKIDRKDQTNNSTASSKKPKKEKKIRSGTMAAVVAKRKAAQKKEQEKKKLKRLNYGILCPRHGVYLSKGHRAVIPIDGKDEQIELFYCYDCKQFYFTSKKVEYGKTGKYNGWIAKNIQTSRYKWNRGIWECIEYNEPEITPTEHHKTPVTRTVIGKSSEEDTAKIEIARKKALLDAKRAKEVRERFDPQSDILYIHKGMIKCLQNKHDVISVTLDVPTDVVGITGTVNANYCFDCDKFFMSLDEYGVYRKKGQIMLVRFQFLEGTSYDSYTDRWADKSPLMLAGYSVSATKGYSEGKRRRILSRIIDNGIVEKHEIIRYINFFISIKKGQSKHEEAIEKWSNDLEFVRNYNIDQQKQRQITGVKQHGNYNS